MIDIAAQLTANLESLEAERQRLRDEQKRMEQAKREQETRAQASKAALALWVARELQRRLVLGGLTPALVEAHLKNSKSPENELWAIVDGLLTSPVYGFELTQDGFLFNGKPMRTVERLEQEVKNLTGDYGDINGAHLLEGLLYAHLTGEESPINYALTHLNPYPTDLEQSDANELFQLTGYHHVLGSLAGGTPQRPSYVVTAPADDSQADNGSISE